MIPYKAAGELILDEDMNGLVSELDRKTGLALDGKPFPYLMQTGMDVAREYFRPYFGPAFAFATGNRCYSGFFCSAAYDHSVFTAAAASAVQYTGPYTPVVNLSAGYVRINPVNTSYFIAINRLRWNGSVGIDWRITETLFAFSLQVHRRLYTPLGGQPTMLRVAETFVQGPGANSTSPDTTNGAFARAAGNGIGMHSTLQQAELIFEGGVTSLDFQGTWDKYNFFRVHVCQAEQVTIRFRNTAGVVAHTLVVPGYSSKCVRRSGVDGTYTDGFNYFQRFVSGDRRYYQQTNPNIITNPSLIIPWVNHVLAGVPFYSIYGASGSGIFDRRFSVPTVMLDPQVKAPLPRVTGCARTACSATPCITPASWCMWIPRRTRTTPW